MFAGVFGPVIAPYDVGPHALDLAHKFQGPSAAHWLGTDSKGLDTLSQLLWGARSALTLSRDRRRDHVDGRARRSARSRAGTAALVDELVMRVVDILMAFPGILMNIAIVATVAAPGVGVVIFALCGERLGRLRARRTRRRCSRCASATTWRRRSRSARRTAA